MKKKYTTICFCLNVTDYEIEKRIKRNQLTTVKQIMMATGAGSSCGRCKSNLQTLLMQQQPLQEPSQGPW